MRRKLTLNNVLRAIQNEPKEDKELFGKMILQMGIPNVKKTITKVRKLSQGSFKTKGLEPLAFFYFMVQAYKFFQFKDLMTNDMKILKELKRNMINLNSLQD